MDRGPLLFEYTPLPMSPMSVALLLLLGIVLVTSPVLLPRELFLPRGWFPVNGVCLLTFAAVLAGAFLQWPSPTRIFGNGIERSLPAWRRLIRERAWLPWAEVRNVYPATYEVSGAAMSPFASSAGTLVHTGLGIETGDGRRCTVRFTPGTIRRFRGESPGFTYAMEAVRQAFAGLGRSLVSDVHAYSDPEIVAMHAEARRPLLGLDVIVYAFFLPPTIVAVALLAMNWVRVVPDPALLVAVFALGAIPPLASMWYTLRKSRRRNYLLSELAKHEEHVRARSA